MLESVLIHVTIREDAVINGKADRGDSGMENTIKNKMFKKCLWIICLGLLALFMAGCTFSSESGKPGETTENQAEGNTADKADAGQTKDIMILFTSDVHCGVDEGFGLEGLEQIRSNLQQKGYQVLLVDDGDFLQGGIMGSVTRGQAIVDLMNDMINCICM